MTTATYVRSPDAARILGLSENTLRKWRCQRTGPAWSRVGTRTVVYDVADLRAFVEASRPAAA